MVTPTIRIVKDAIASLELNKDYTASEFCAQIAIDNGRSLPGVRKALCALTDAHEITRGLNTFRRV